MFLEIHVTRERTKFLLETHLIMKRLIFQHSWDVAVRLQILQRQRKGRKAMRSKKL